MLYTRELNQFAEMISRVLLLVFSLVEGHPDANTTRDGVCSKQIFFLLIFVNLEVAIQRCS